jgi:hypothetical protein
LALPKKHLPRAQVIFVAQAGRKFRLFSLTMQRYEYFIAVHEHFARIIILKHEISLGQSGQGQNGQNRKRIVKFRHYNINILFIYSEQ